MGSEGDGTNNAFVSSPFVHLLPVLVRPVRRG